MAKTIHKLINEAELFASIAKGDEKAFEIVYHHYNKRLVPFVERMVKSEEIAKELIQDIFVHIWINRHLLENIQHPTSYLFNTASNKTVRYLQKIANDARLLDKIAAFSPSHSDETEERLMLRDSMQSIELAVAQLPAQRRKIWELSRNEGLTHDQIAEQLNISKNTVKNQMVDAVKFIRNFLDKRAGILSASIIILLTQK